MRIPKMSFLYTFLSFMFLVLFLYKLNLLSYQTNDDFGLILLANGFISGNLEINLWFIEIPFGVVLYFLNSMNDSIPWHGLIQYFLLALSFSLYVKLISETKTSLVQKFFLFTPVFFIFYCTVSLQFTQTAAISVSVGIGTFLLLKNKFYNFISLICLVLGFLLRFEVGLISSVLVFFSYLYYSFLINKKNPNYLNKNIFNFKKILILIIFVVLICSSHILTRSANSPILSQASKDFIIYNSSRGNIHGWDYAYLNSNLENKIRKEVGWSQNDLKLFKTFFYQDSNVYNLEKIQRYSSLYNENIYKLKDNLFNFKSFWINFINVNLTNFLIVGLLLFIFLFNSMNRFIMHIPFLIFFIILFISVSLMSSMSSRLFNSFVFIFLFCATLINILTFTDKSSNFFSRYFKNLSNYLIIALLFTCYCLNLYNISKIISTRYNEIRVCRNYNYERIFNFRYDKPILAFPSFSTELSKCLSPLDNVKKNNIFWQKIIPIGWTLNTPQLNTKVMKLQLKNNLFDNLADETVYVGIANNLELQMISQFAVEHKIFRINWPPAPFTYSDNNLQVWKSLN